MIANCERHLYGFGKVYAELSREENSDRAWDVNHYVTPEAVDRLINQTNGAIREAAEQE